MSGQANYRKLLKILTVSSKIVGVEIWTAPGQCRPASYYLSFHVIVYFVCTCYTVNKYAHDLLHVLKVLITLGTAVQLYMKFFVFYAKSFDFKDYTEMVEKKLIVRFQNGTPAEVAVLAQTDRIMWIAFRLLCLAGLGTGFLFGLYTVLVYVVSGVVMPLFLYEFPYCDWSTKGGYLFNMVFQVNLLSLGVVGFVSSDSIFIFCTVYALAAADIFLVHLSELQNILNDPESMASDLSAMREKWLQCIYDHQQTVILLNNLGELYGFIILVQVSMGVFAFCDGLLLVCLTDWYPVYFFMMALFCELTLYFVLGHIVELKVNMVYDTIISMPWYKLPVRNQKEFSFLLFRQQCPMILTICDFAPLNFATYMSVLRGMYQFFVVILQYVG